MEGELVAEVHIKVKSFHLHEFWWSHYGVQPRYEDILQIQSDDKKVDYGARLFSKGFVRKSLEGQDAIAAADRKTIEERWGKTVEDLLAGDTILFSPQHHPKPLEFREVSPWFLEGGKITHPLLPRFSIYHPAEYETYEIIEQSVKKMVQRYARVFAQIGMINEKPSEEEARSSYKNHEREAERLRGKKRELRMDLQSLSLLVGSDEIAHHPEIKYGIWGEDEHLYVERKDGSRQPIGRPRLKLITDK